MTIPRRARPRFPMDDSWLCSDPMTIVLDYEAASGSTREQGGREEPAAAGVCPGLAADTDRAVFASVTRLTDSAVAVPGRSWRREMSVFCGVVLSIGVLCMLWVYNAKTMPGDVHYAPKAADVSCGAVIAGAPASRTL